MSDQCPAQTERLSADVLFICDWPDGHAGTLHRDAAEHLLWEQPPDDPPVPPYRSFWTSAFRQAVSDLHMVGVRTGEDYERVVGEIIATIYAPPQKPSVFGTANCEQRR